MYVGEAHFLRGLAYSVLAETYGGVPVVLSEISTSEARNLKRSSREDTWQQALDDYDVAIANLGADAPEKGRATKGAALGMKMRAYLYQGKYKAVLECVDQIDALKKYGLFHSYATLFDPANEGNKEVLFDIQYIEGEIHRVLFWINTAEREPVVGHVVVAMFLQMIWWRLMRPWMGALLIRKILMRTVILV